MKPRIEKKLSKKLAAILKNVRGFTPKDVWIDKEYSNEACDIHWTYNNQNGLTSKQKRENWQRTGVRVNNMPSVGGGLDYWGEAYDVYSVLESAIGVLKWVMFPCDEFDIDTGKGGWPIVNVRLTGKKVIDLAKRYANGERKEAA
ncbi:hypothetical protein [Shewanella xiamenensis]|uniref:Phage protein n=1 Tax=Shewanella xiamenensis TaxID=332186 RepID=A0ABT6U868_9GAMM|nr:hypothetical protein [Shewanella xiamenensis]MDI5830657.1 hypothetical protein [Shewanella xiamenensis]